MGGGGGVWVGGWVGGEIVIERNALRGELAEARKLCGEVALSIEANSHYTQDEDLRTVLHDASIRLRATAKGRER